MSRMSRIHSFDKPQSRIDAQLAQETAAMERLIMLDTATAGASRAHEKPMSPAEIQAAYPPPTPPGVTRDKYGHIYVRPSYEVLK